MNSTKLRKRSPISYFEIEDPDPDEYLYCEPCRDYVYEYCSIHGPLLVIPDDKVPAKKSLPSYVPRAALTIPHVFLHIAPSIIPGAGLGVFNTLTLPRGVRFGPYLGEKTVEVNSSYCWQLYDRNNKPCHAVDAVDANNSNWMRYVNCARHCSEQNLVAYQYQGRLYYRTIKIIPRFTELMVYYGSEFANNLRIDLRNYNSPFGFAPIWGPETKISKPNDAKNEKCGKNTLEATFAVEEFIFIEAPPKMETSFDENLEIRTFERNRTTDNGQETTDIYNIEENSNKENLNKSILNSPIAGQKNNSFICEECSKIFTSKDSLIKHIKEHNKSMQDMFKKCNECNFQTISDYSFQNHLKFHDKSRPYECEYCKYRFKSRTTFKRHVEIHLNVYRSCQFCNFKTIRLQTLKKHLLIHTEPISTACKQKRNLKIQKHDCNICDFKTHRLDSLKRHILRHARLSKTSHLAKCVLSMTSVILGKKHVCEICDYKTERPCRLRKHQKIHECHIASKKCTSVNNI